MRRLLFRKKRFACFDASVAVSFRASGWEPRRRKRRRRWSTGPRLMVQVFIPSRTHQSRNVVSCRASGRRKRLCDSCVRFAAVGSRWAATNLRRSQNNICSGMMARTSLRRRALVPGWRTSLLRRQNCPGTRRATTPLKNICRRRRRLRRCSRMRRALDALLSFRKFSTRCGVFQRTTVLFMSVSIDASTSTSARARASSESTSTPPASCRLCPSQRICSRFRRR
mmetsp:Transcript_22967/g.74835  ORF Transcript_22967/g.74835 Transcript_22967/m.74835 type:complete len:225 (-) Transcript_22967:1124-1798(-)